ncbi:unnamed protein product [Leuciscus chuanchicus]
MHHGVEQEMRRRPGGVVYDFEDFVSIVKNSNSKKMELKKMPRLADLEVIQLRCGSRSMWVKTSHMAEEFMEVDFLQKKFSTCIPFTLRSQDLGVEEVKKKGILQNLVPLMPATRSFFLEVTNCAK